MGVCAAIAPTRGTALAGVRGDGGATVCLQNRRHYRPRSPWWHCLSLCAVAGVMQSVDLSSPRIAGRFVALAAGRISVDGAQYR